MRAQWGNFECRIFKSGSSFLKSSYTSFIFSKSNPFCLNALPPGLMTDMKFLLPWANSTYIIIKIFHWLQMFFREGIKSTSTLFTFPCFHCCIRWLKNSSSFSQRQWVNSFRQNLRFPFIFFRETSPHFFNCCSQTLRALECAFCFFLHSFPNSSVIFLLLVFFSLFFLFLLAGFFTFSHGCLLVSFFLFLSLSLFLYSSCLIGSLLPSFLNFPLLSVSEGIF